MEKKVDGIDGSSLKDNTVGQDKTDFFEDGINLLKDVIKGYYLNNGGVLTANPTYSTSGFIEVKAGDTVIPTWQRAAIFFDENKNFYSEIYETSIPKNKPLVAPVDGFVRVSYPSAEEPNMMITKGTSVPSEYQRPGKKIPNLLVESSQIIGNENQSEDEALINLPSKLYATVGEEFIIYDKNILREDDKKYNLNYTSNFGARYDGYFSSIPTSVGTYSLTINVYDKTTLVATKTVEVTVSEKRTTPITVLEFGDSIVRANGNGYITEFIKNRLGSNVQFIGTMGEGENKWEGRGGWSAAKYRTGDSYEGVVNPFYNPTKQDFDFSYYMNQNGFSEVDVVFINLGTNDTFSYKSDESLKNAIPNIIANLKYIRNNILAFDSTIKVVFNITIPGNANQQKFAEQKLSPSKLDQDQWRYKYNNFIWVNEMIKQFDNNQLIPVHASINTETEIADHVHPKLEGYESMAIVQYSYLNSI